MQQRQRDPYDLQRLSYVRFADLFTVIGLIVYLLIMQFLEGTVGDSLAGGSFLAVAALVSIVPTILWLTMFLVRDWNEPEPRRTVFQIFVLGLLVAAAVGEPVIYDFFEFDDWVYHDLKTTILGNILVRGFVIAFAVYAIVRFSVFRSAEFDELTDGFIYATAAGLGYVTAHNLRFVLAQHDANFFNVGATIAVDTLAIASFAGIVGWALGRERFTAAGLHVVPLAVGLAAVMLGTFYTIRTEIPKRMLTNAGPLGELLFGLILAGAFALVTTAILFWVIKRDANWLQQNRRIGGEG